MTDIPAGPRFPEQELVAMAEYHEAQAAWWKDHGRNGSGARNLIGQHHAWATTLRQAIQAHTDLQTRFLEDVADLRGQLGQRSAAA